MNADMHPTGDIELVALVRKMLRDLAAPSEPVDRELWAALVDSEVHAVGLPAESGGAGGTVADLVATVFECARSAAAVPVVENHLAQRLRVEAGLGVHSGLSLCATAVPESDGAVLATVAWVDEADQLVVIDRHSSAESGRIVNSWTSKGDRPSTDLADQVEREVRISADELDLAESIGFDRIGHRTMTNLLRAAQLSGGVRGCYELSRRYARERRQFGVRIDSFPAVQLHLVQLAQAAAITRVSVFRAAAAVEESRAGGSIAARSARIVCGDAAREAVRCAHQLHGAIGMTREYHLARLTRRLHWWRLVDPDPLDGPPARFFERMWPVLDGARS